ncbi:hypothetical protein EJB05_15680, partial [Eragrostis curvula]
MIQLLRLFVSIVSSLSYLLLWLIGHVRAVLFFRRRSGRKPRHLIPYFAALEWEITLRLLYYLLTVVALLLLPRAIRAATFYLRRVNFRHCWCYFKRAVLLLVPKLRVHDDTVRTRLPENLPRRFSFQELEAATGGFSDQNRLGNGSFGVVYRGVLWNGNGKVVIAVKRLNPSVAGSAQDEQWQFENEARLLQLGHCNIVQLIGYCCEEAHRILCYEYMAKGSLDGFLFGKCSTLDWAARYKIIKGICRGLRYLHEECKPNQIMLHLDIKPSNILLDDAMNPKISDFGLSRLFDRGSTHTISNVIAPIGYSAPEYFMSGKADRLANKRGRPPAYVKDDCLVRFKKCISIGLRCVSIIPNERPRAGELMNMLNTT